MPGKQIEVDETEFVALQQVAGLMKTMLDNKDASHLIKKATKIVAPNASIPEIDVAEPIMGEVKKLREELEAEKKARAEEKAQDEADRKARKFASRWESDKQALRDEGWMDDAIAGVEKFAEEQGIPDLEAAALKYAKRHPVPAPVQPGGITNFNLFEPVPESDDTMKKLMESGGNDPAALNSLINKALADVRGGNRRAA